MSELLSLLLSLNSTWCLKGVNVVSQSMCERIASWLAAKHRLSGLLSINMRQVATRCICYTLHVFTSLRIQLEQHMALCAICCLCLPRAK